MLDIQRREIDRISTILRGANAKFKIILEDGTEFGDLEVAPAKRRAASPYPHGSVTKVFLPFVADMKLGDVAVIPCGGYDIERVRGTLAGWTCKHWGNGSAKTMIDHVKNEVQVLRIT